MSPPHPNEAPDGDASLPAGRLPKAIRLVPTHQPAPDPPPIFRSARGAAPVTLPTCGGGARTSHSPSYYSPRSGETRLDSTHYLRPCHGLQGRQYTRLSKHM